MSDDAKDCCETCGEWTGKSIEQVERPAMSGPPERFKVIVKSRGKFLEFFPAKSTFVFGRANGVDAQLLDEALSRRQAQLVFEDDGVYIEDLGSACGTFVDGTHADRAKVGEGAKIQFGNSMVWIVPR